MTYSLFIDDERAPNNFPPVGDKWVIVRTMEEAVRYIDAAGFPQFITFDHDLGEDEPSGMDIAKWLIAQDQRSNGKCLSDEFTFAVHSQNSPGTANIKGLLSNYLSCRKTSMISSTC